MAKETAGSRNKGQTTRIFTADDDLDEKFWLKYLGEEFRNAVHLQVDAHNNVVPLTDHLEKPLNLPTLKYLPKIDKRTRFVRQPAAQEDLDKQLPVENLDENDCKENQYPTEKPETFKVFLTTTTPSTTTTTTAVPPPANKKQYSCSTQQRASNKKIPKHKKDTNLLPQNKYNKQRALKLKRCRVHKATNEPIVVHLPETDDSIHHINTDYLPVAPSIYHQNAHLYPESKTNRQFFRHKKQLIAEQAPDWHLNNQNMEFYEQPVQLNTQDFYPHRHTTVYTTHSHQPHFATVHHHTRSQQPHILTPT